MSTNKLFVKHNGVEIYITPAGSFSATINGEAQCRPSVAAIKKLIEKKATFAPFDVIDEQRAYYGQKGDKPGTIKTLTITGSKKNNRSRSFTSHVWIDSTGRDHTTVHPDTPENRAAMQAVIDKRFEIEKIEKQLAEELRALESKLVRRNLDAEIKRAEIDKAAVANGSDPLVAGEVYSVDHSRKGKFVAKLLNIGTDFVECEIVSGEAHMLSKWNENGQPGDVLELRPELAKWKRVDAQAAA